MANPPRPAELPPGFDEENPYLDVDLAEYPDWWRRNILEFQSNGMRPYRPPRFTDGQLVPPIIKEMEEEVNVDIQLQAVDPGMEGKWDLIVDGRQATSIPRRRTGGGYTLYQLDAEEFVKIIRNAASKTDSQN